MAKKFDQDNVLTGPNAKPRVKMGIGIAVLFAGITLGLVARSYTRMDPRSSNTTSEASARSGFTAESPKESIAPLDPLPEAATGWPQPARRPETFDVFRFRSGYGFVGYGYGGSSSPSGMPPVIRRILENAEQVTLFSINPVPEKRTDATREFLQTASALSPPATLKTAESSDDLFHNYRILGKTEITDQADKVLLMNALFSGVKEASGVHFFCEFEPRHGLRAKFQGDTIDLVICFTCSGIRSYGLTETFIDVSKSPRATFDQPLRARGIPIAK